MRKIFAAVFTVSLFACNDSGTKTETATTENTEVKANVPTNTYGFTPTYSASFVMDSAKNTETVLALWKEFQDGDLGPGYDRTECWQAKDSNVRMTIFLLHRGYK